jgi:hypothetical protein
MVVGTESLQHNFSREGAGIAGRGERSKSWSFAVAKTILVGPDIEKGAKILEIKMPPASRSKRLLSLVFSVTLILSSDPCGRLSERPRT